MFRKPRENPSQPSGDVKSSVGRPPTPPSTPHKTPFTLATPPSVPTPKMAGSKAKAKSTRAVPLPTIGRQGPTGSSKKTSSTPKGKDKANGNIMNFFQKSEQDTGLFVQEKRTRNRKSEDVENQDPLPEDGSADDSLAIPAQGRFNESGGSVKRRKTNSDEEHDAMNGTVVDEEVNGNIEDQRNLPKKIGPFLEESDSEQDEEQPEALIGLSENVQGSDEPAEMILETAHDQEPVTMEDTNHANGVGIAKRPPLVREETSYAPDAEDFKDFEGMDDFDEDIFEEGDEFMERRYMEEQALLEAEENEKDYDPLPIEETSASRDGGLAPDSGLACPICGISLAKVSEHDADVHVNHCLDGKPTPLPEPKQPSVPPPSNKTENAVSSAQHFRRPNRAPKPAQASPFILGQAATTGGSAFNKLMSGHAEDAAWAEAAASEHASRGKPSYQRTCPFYKILPGLSICVDAFRYGAVEGCQAYFLSHFHSDHYVGLTSNWTHGPIYCSKVTGNLVRQQLRVDPKFVVDLEFEETVEVPSTKGVKVTMISANHCPGSSLFLFEKTVGKKSNGEPKLQRILHCGDFRACRKHVEHPLLMPGVRDKVTGKTKEQKIDVCYLDTTYLNPKYAFPSQDKVIKACAEMCISLSKHSVDESDGWEQMKKQRAGEGMAKFVKKESNPDIKIEPTEDDDTDAIKLEKNPNGSQQVLSTITTPNVEQGRGRLLVVVGTYSIGKERICLGIAKALNSKIYAPPSKQRIVAALEDPELDERMTTDPRVAQVHMTPLFEIRAETLDDYLKDYFPHFTRAVGFRPSGWNYRPPNSRFTESPSVQTVLHSENWKSTFSMRDLVPQRGSSSRASCFGVPYSEHSSFRELTMFCCALRIEKIIPTVNVGSKKSRERMKWWCERWAAERRKNGLYQLPEGSSW